MNTKRVMGTTAEAIAKAEVALGFRFSPSYKEWLLRNNGIRVDYVEIFPVFDERDPPKTWDSIVRQYDSGNWFPGYFEEDGLSGENLLPFGAEGGGNYYCFDYSRQREDGEVPVVWWSHETAEYEDRAGTFAEFVSKVLAGEIYD